MPGKLTREKTAQYRADALADLRYARATGQPEWVASLRKRIEFLDAYYARHFGPVTNRNGDAAGTMRTPLLMPPPAETERRERT